MGLLDIFNKKTSTTSENSPSTNLLNLDLDSLLKKSVDFKKYGSATGFGSMEYECTLDSLVLMTFDTIRIRLGWPEKEIKKDTNVGIITTFLLKGKKITMQQIAFVVNSIAKVCNVRDDNWTNVDEMRIKSGVWRGRNFMVDGIMITIELDRNDGVTLCIVGYDKFRMKFAIA